MLLLFVGRRGLMVKEPDSKGTETPTAPRPAQCVCVCVCVHVYVVYEDTNLYNDMGMT